MPIMRDCGNAKIIVTLHSEIGDVHRLAADVDYFYRANNNLHSENGKKLKVQFIMKE